MAYKFHNHMFTQHDPAILFTALSVQFAAINHLLFFRIRFPKCVRLNRRRRHHSHCRRRHSESFII